MSHNERKLFRPPLVVVFSLSAALMFAFGRAPSISIPILGPTPVSGRANQNGVFETNGSTATPLAVTQRNFRRDHDMTVEIISVGPEGFAPATLTRPNGRFLLAINNRSGLKELTFQLIREDGKLMQEAQVNPQQPNSRNLVNLPVGIYRLTEASHAEWVCRIAITAQR